MKKKSLAIIFLVSSFIVNNNYSQFNTVIRNYHTQKEESTQLKNIEVSQRKNEIEQGSSSYYFKTANQQKTIPTLDC